MEKSILKALASYRKMEKKMRLLYMVYDYMIKGGVGKDLGHFFF